MKPKTPFEIAESWYGEHEIWNDIRSRIETRQIPTNVASLEFATWLTSQYRLAMAKGIQLGREDSKPESCKEIAERINIRVKEHDPLEGFMGG